MHGRDGVTHKAQGVSERAAGARGLRADVSQRVPVQRDGRRGVEVHGDVLREGRGVPELGVEGDARERVRGEDRGGEGDEDEAERPTGGEHEREAGEHGGVEDGALHREVQDEWE